MKAICARLLCCTRGATAIEYGLIVSLIVIALVSGVVALGRSTGATWDNMANKVAAVEP